MLRQHMTSHGMSQTHINGDTFSDMSYDAASDGNTTKIAVNNNGEKYMMDLSNRDIMHLLGQHAFNSRDSFSPKALPDRLLEDYPISPQCKSTPATPHQSIIKIHSRRRSPSRRRTKRRRPPPTRRSTKRRRGPGRPRKPGRPKKRARTN
jgi:hypothetical protein